MGTNGNQWEPMGTNGNQWEPNAFWLPPVGNPQITRDLPIAAKTAWDIVPEEKVYNAFLQQWGEKVF